jgi:hypothetical protein
MFQNFSPEGLNFININGKTVPTDLIKNLLNNSASSAPLVYTFLNSISYLSKSFVTTTQTSNPTSISVSSNGEHIYVADGTSRAITQYDMTAWDLATATYNTKQKIIDLADGWSFEHIQISPDGTSIYMLTAGYDDIVQYTLSTPWDITTATTASKRLDLSSLSSNIQAFCISSDGREVVSGAATTNTLYRHTLSTPWDISTASLTSTEAAFFSSAIQCLQLSPDGTQLYSLRYDVTGNILEVFATSTPYDISTMINTNQTLQFTEGTMDNISIQDNHLFSVVRGTDTIYQYSFTP